MKYLTLLILFFAFKASSEQITVRLKTDYHQNLGRIAIELKGEIIGVVVDRNRCIPDEFGEPFACTEMAIHYFESKIRKILESKDYKQQLFEIVKLPKFRLMMEKKKVRLVEINEKTGQTVASYALYPEYYFN